MATAASIPWARGFSLPSTETPQPGWDGVRLCQEWQKGNVRICPNVGMMRRLSLAERWEKRWAFKQLVVTAQTMNLEQRVEGEIAAHSPWWTEPSARASQGRSGKHHSGCQRAAGLQARSRAQDIWPTWPRLPETFSALVLEVLCLRKFHSFQANQDQEAGSHRSKARPRSAEGIQNDDYGRVTQTESLVVRTRTEKRNGSERGKGKSLQGDLEVFH